MVTLVAMTSEEYQRYVENAIVIFANEKVKAGNWTEEESLDRAKSDYETLLPQGEKSENNYLFTIYDNEQAVGIIWLARKSEDEGFIYEILISDEFRGMGYGKKAMQQLEVFGRELGLKKIGLHVFGHNKPARGLYEKLGYIETNIKMEKVL
ncbi:GNAT family N-acetyltransferase [Bacillus suaedaesalsae]|uniref:GNAT family N-acetyltransferase n=1 Tax=Bacillus suaedaesalsae TaxID=2810349 RepID=A0ABS2DLI2_9BACI|nr:GNAT family N-acetyltransferase [Bacillus suaedaesalsae]MBM6619355.1 GNAT family N-acetyltransferase [Bacillus suaedaesalsae]